MRKNASFESVAESTFNLAGRALKEWRKWTAIYEKSHDFHDQCRADAAWAHYRDLGEVSDQLLRLRGLTEDEVEAKKKAAWYR